VAFLAFLQDRRERDQLTPLAAAHVGSLAVARAAAEKGRMPPQATNPAPVYRNLALVLEQLGLAWDETSLSH